MAEPSHTGGCRCGAVRFAARADPDHVSYCHCVDCRRATGAPLAAFVGFLASEVVYVGADTGSSYGQGGVSRSFCTRCGAPLAYRDARLYDHVYFYLGAMDRPEMFRPTVHAYVSQKLPHFHIGDDLPQLHRTSVPRPGANS